MQDTPGTQEVEPIQTVLIVDDDAAIGDILVQMFRDETQYQVIYVPDGFAALKTVRTVTPNLILLDYQLPSMDGLECLELLRATKGIEQTPIILMSAKVPEQARKRNDVCLLEKPFDLENLLRLVQQTLQPL